MGAAVLSLTAAVGAGTATVAEEPVGPEVGAAVFTDVPASGDGPAHRTADARTDAVVNVIADAVRPVALDRDAVTALLAGAPADGSTAAPVRIELPAPDGTTHAFDVGRNATMSPRLAARFPDIATFDGSGVTDPDETIALDLTPAGFHAQVLRPGGGWMIDPAVTDDDVVHVSYLRSDARPQNVLTESDLHESVTTAGEHDPLGAEASAPTRRPGDPAAPQPAARTGEVLRTHRIAVTADPAYTAFHGGTVDDGLAAIVTAVNRVSAIFQQEIAVRLQLVPESASLVFVGADGSCVDGSPTTIASITGGGGDAVVETDGSHGLVDGDIAAITGTGHPFYDARFEVSVVDSDRFELVGSRFFGAGDVVGGSVDRWNLTDGAGSVDPACGPTSNRSADLFLNQAVVDSIVGEDGYDVGHLVSTAGGGLANLGVVGVPGLEATGVTGISTPVNDVFVVDYLAHELGHQYGADHPFNGIRGACGSNAEVDAAYEPGSGSTLMSYAGICGRDDLQRAVGSEASVDPYFHWNSTREILEALDRNEFLFGPIGTTTPGGNSVPTVTGSDDVVVPAQTPFFLNAVGADADGDAVTTTIEQGDLGQPRALDDPAYTSGPLLRSFPPTDSSRRDVPRLSELRIGATNVDLDAGLGETCPPLLDTNGDEARAAALCWSQLVIPLDGPLAVGSLVDLDFVATVRDGAGTGTSAGGSATDDIRVTVSNTGARFDVTGPDSGTFSADSVPVTWTVAGTDQAPIDAATVSIRVSTDGARTFPLEVLADTPNDGAAVVAVPNQAADQVAFLVHSGDYDTGAGFFDITSDDVTIVPAGPAVRVDQADDQADPTTDDTIRFTAVFNDSVTGFDSSDVVLSGTAGAATATVSGSGTTYTIAVTGMTRSGTVTVSIPAGAATGSGQPSAASTSTDDTVEFDAEVESVAEVVSLVPARFVDTRAGGAVTVDRRFEGLGRLPTNGRLTVDVAGRGLVPSDGVSAVVVNVTAINPVSRGFVTVYPCAGDPPNTASLNFSGARTVSGNEIVAKLSRDGQVCIATDVATDLTVDVTGYVPAESAIVSLDPARILETRSFVGADTVDERFEGIGRLPAGVPTEIVVTDRAGVPDAGVAAVLMNVTAINPDGRGFARVYPCGDAPTAASLNYGRRGVVAGNEVVAKVSARGTVCVVSDVTTDMTMDVVGYVPDTSTYVAVTPQRFAETRSTPDSRTVDREFEATGAVDGGTRRTIKMTGRGTVPASGVSAVVVNVTAINPASRGFMTVFPCGAVPTASSLNYARAGTVVGNEIIVRLDAGGRLCLTSDVTTDVTLDVVGYVPG